MKDAFILTCPHCGRTSVGQIRYIGIIPEVEYFDNNNRLTITTTGECFDCGQQVQVVEYATIDKIEVEV